MTNIIESDEKVVILTKGQSMLPFIVGDRDSVELTKVKGEVCVGEILLAKIANPLRYVIHRVIRVEGDEIILMGDGNLIGTERCHKKDIVAQVTSIITPQKIIYPNTVRQQYMAKIWQKLKPVRGYLLILFRQNKYFYDNRVTT
ncbi:MAG: S24/S26 family peptidase [Rikenellaceae bacterium]